MVIRLCILIGGVLSLVMALLHTCFYKMFKWEEVFVKIGPINAKIIYTIHIFLIPFFLIFAILSFVFVDELSQCSGLSLGVLLCYSLFWLVRAIWQVTYLKPPKDFKGSPAIHYVMILLFILLFISYSLPLILKYGFGL